MSTPAWVAKRPQRPCARCGALTYSMAATPLHRRCRRRAVARRDSWGERQRRRQFLAEWRAEHGPLCLGWRRPVHLVDERVNPLTADHVDSVARTGPEGEAGPLQPLCRRCNASKREASGRAVGTIPDAPARTYSPSGTC